MAIEKGAAIDVEQCGNGFIVTPKDKHPDDPKQVLVFESVWNLSKWLGEHFPMPPEPQPVPLVPKMEGNV